MPSEPLPLFPLNIVLFPRMPLPLHIFEERYKTMINRCLADDRAFGVILIREGSEVGAPAVPQTIGTRARIHAVERLAEGRMNLFTEGAERFRLLDYASEPEAYLIGITEPLHDAPADPVVLNPLAADIKTLFHNYFQMLVAFAGQEMPDYELPTSPEELSFVIAAVVQSDMACRQAFLEMTDTAARLERQRSMLEQEIERLRAAHENFKGDPEPLTAEWRKSFLSRN
jgi:Lon protease-like protein